jgi:AAA domain/Toprim domain
VTPLERFRSALEQAGSRQQSPGNWTCPAHDDQHASLTVKEGRDGRVILNCHANSGCTFEDIVSKVGLQPQDLFPDKATSNGSRSTITATYPYTDEDGHLLFEAVRLAPKDFRQRRRARPSDPPERVDRDGWVWNLQGTRRVLYHLRLIIGARERGRDVWVCEGEKDVHALEQAGAVATCNPMGAGKWHDDYTSILAGMRVTVVADNDPPGRTHAETVASSLRQAGCTVRVVLPAKGKDAYDHLTAGLDLDQFIPIEGAQTTFDQAEPTTPRVPLAVEIDIFLNAEDEEYDWLIEGLLERGDRVILTGPEGGGKSTLLQQLAVQAGAGIHPFTLEPITPVRVLYVDLENSKPHVRRKLNPLRVKAGEQLGENLVFITVWPAGMDLLHDADVIWLEDRIKEATPELVIIGPLYKMSSGDPTSEEVARKVSAALDKLRAAHAFALLIEAHSPHAPSGGKRPQRPYGASMWLRWPEFGIYLDQTSGLLTHWRGARDEREWPTALRRGGEWPWTAADNPKEALWDQILAWVDQHGRTTTGRRLEAELGRPRSSIRRAISAHQDMWDQLCESLGKVD